MRNLNYAEHIAEEYGFDMERSNEHSGELFVRFMGAVEYYDLMSGRELVNSRNHATHANTDSVGFCFLPLDESELGALGNDEVSMLRYSKMFLSGIVSDFVAVVFENAYAPLHKGNGTYADPFGYWDDVIGVCEYSTERYDRDSMLPVRAYFWPMDGSLEAASL